MTSTNSIVYHKKLKKIIFVSISLMIYNIYIFLNLVFRFQEIKYIKTVFIKYFGQFIRGMFSRLSDTIVATDMFRFKPVLILLHVSLFVALALTFDINIKV